MVITLRLAQKTALYLDKRLFFCYIYTSFIFGDMNILRLSGAGGRDGKAEFATSAR